MNACPHPDDQAVRTVYYLMCGACKQIRVVSYCNYATECHPECKLAPVCVQPARQKYHAAVPLEVPAELVEAARPAVSGARPRLPAGVGTESR